MFESYVELLDHVEPVGVAGQVEGVCGLTVSVADFPAPIGASCRICRGERAVDGRVIGLAGEHTLVMPLGPMTGIARGDRVTRRHTEPAVRVGRDMLGRVLDGLARPLDGGAAPSGETRTPIWPEPLPPMQRRRITDPLATGVRVIDAMLTVGRGQRMGIFSGSGVGKSVLLGMIALYTAADVTVIALIGERGREVRDFIERDLGPEGLKRSVVVVSTSDEPPLVRVQAAAVATAVAECFRDRGCDVLLLMDSLTRLATAQRQIGLAAGEPPATKGFPPSVFSLLPQLLERSGRTQSGSVTGFYTVLAEADDLADPVADATRSTTDGHILLSRALATRGHYPAVDCLQSVSRVRVDVVDDAHRRAADDIQRLLAVHGEIEEMVNIGAYRRGSHPQRDLALEAAGPIREFLAQPIDEASSFAETRERLIRLHRGIFGEGLGRGERSGDAGAVSEGELT